MIDNAVRHALMFMEEDGVKGVIPRQLLEEYASRAMSSYPNAKFSIKDVINVLETKYSIQWEEATGIFGNKDHADWLADKNISWEYWSRYRKYLNAKEGWTPNQLETIDKDTTKVLKRLEDPDKKGPWFTKGLVVGDVQSGKTAHFTGVLNKAVDSGYRIIIVLAGIHNSLRSQTQERLDSELVGYSTLKQKYIGVGNLIYGEHPKLKAQQITHSGDNGDLKSQQRPAQISGRDPFIFVIKKNKTPLETLISWLKAQKIDDVPAIIIDDEADQASLNTNDEETDPTTLNRLIRTLLGTLKKKAYVGYTATPYANIYVSQEDDDLFPEDFIIRLNPPSNYVGAAKAFGIDADPYFNIEGEEPLGLTVTVEDHEAFIPRSHRRDYVPNELPHSLREALMSFLVSSTIRSWRVGYEKHNTMLVHVTRFNDVQEEVFELVDAWIKDVKQIFAYDNGPAFKKFQEECESVYKSYPSKTSQVQMNLPSEDNFNLPDFKALIKQMEEVVRRLQPKLFNGSSDDILDYKSEKGIYIIAIGGNRLSRGLTLDGLIVSYYLRNSTAYDSLMQMGRWFGYRKNYLDLCRIYITQDLTDAFRFISLATKELNANFTQMEKDGCTPKLWGLKVRIDDSGRGMQITAANKRRNGTDIPWTFTGKLVQTLSLSLVKNDVERNYRAYTTLLDKLNLSNAPVQYRKRPVYSWNKVSPDLVLNFLKDYKNHYRTPSSDTALLREFIQSGLGKGMFTDWTVAVVGGENINTEIINESLGLGIPMVTRRKKLEFDKNAAAIIYRGIISKEDEAIDMPGHDKLSGLELRRMRTLQKVLLTIYPVSPGEVVEDFKAENPTYPLDNLYTDKKPIMAFAISFPATGNANVWFTANEVLMRTILAGEDAYES